MRERPLRAAILNYARNPNGNESLHAECLRLASQLSACICVASDTDTASILSYAAESNIPDDVCFVLIAKGYKTSVTRVLLYSTSLAICAAILASHPHFYKDGKVVLTPFDVKCLLCRDDDVFDLFAKWGRIVTDESSPHPLELILQIRAERRRFDANQIDSFAVYDENETAKHFPRLRLLRLLPDYDNFVNVIVSWRKRSRVDVGGVYRKIWRCLVGNLKF
jgi:hypothetical protein